MSNESPSKSDATVNSANELFEKYLAEPGHQVENVFIYFFFLVLPITYIGTCIYEIIEKEAVSGFPAFLAYAAGMLAASHIANLIRLNIRIAMTIFMFAAVIPAIAAHVWTDGSNFMSLVTIGLVFLMGHSFPNLYVMFRKSLHQRGKLRCDWIIIRKGL